MATLLVAAGLAILMGCSNEGCPNANKFRTVTTGTTDLESLTYVSAPWDGPLDEFGPRDTVTFIHSLGVVPDTVVTYLSFSSDGLNTSEVTENAGNQGEIECVDATSIRIKNNTCADFYIRVVAARLGDTGKASSTTCEAP